MRKQTKPVREESIPQPVLERVLREVASLEGGCLPETEEELDAAEERLAGEKVCVPFFSKVLDLIRNAEPDTSRIITIRNKVDDTVVAEMAAAARNGKSIPPEIRAKMDADRRLAEGE